MTIYGSTMPAKYDGPAGLIVLLRDINTKLDQLDHNLEELLEEQDEEALA